MFDCKTTKIQPLGIALFFIMAAIFGLSTLEEVLAAPTMQGTVIAVKGFEATIQVERTSDQAPAVGNKVDLLETNAAGSVVLVRKDWEITEVLSGLVKARPVNATAHDLPKVNMKAVIHLSKQTVQTSPKGKELLTYHDAFSGPKDTKKKFSKAEGKVIMIRGDVIHIRMNDRTQSATEGDYVKLSYTVDGEVIPVGTWRVSSVKDGGLLEALPIESEGQTQRWDGCTGLSPGKAERRHSYRETPRKRVT